ncbi:MAG: DUF4097 family beta strand repeat protein [Acidobacteria bacterium]|nr:DUF4097 family beta strand repeat protein [Acidobacteriota bacterium]
MPSVCRIGHIACLSVVGVALVLSAGCELAFTSFSAEAREEWTRSYPLGDEARLEVRNTNGAIEVETSTDGQLHVRAERIAKAASDAAAKELLKRIEIREEVDGQTVRLRTETPGGLQMAGGRAEVRYVVRLPARASVSVQNTNGRVTLTGLSGPVDARTTNGGVSGRGLTGPVVAQTTNGGVDIEVDEVAEGGVSLGATNGGVQLRLPATARADVSLRCTNGGINTEGLDLETSGERSRRRVEGRLNGGGPPVRLETTNGGVRLRGRSL